MAAGGLVKWQEEGMVTENKVVVQIDHLGQVSGSFLCMKADNILTADYSYVSPCISSNDRAFIVKPSSNLEDLTSVIVFEIQYTLSRTLIEAAALA